MVMSKTASTLGRVRLSCADRRCGSLRTHIVVLVLRRGHAAASLVRSGTNRSNVSFRKNKLSEKSPTLNSPLWARFWRLEADVDDTVLLDGWIAAWSKGGRIRNVKKARLTQPGSER